MTGSDHFAILWEASREKVYRGLHKCGATHEDCEDAIGEATVRALNAFPHFDPKRATFYTWFATIARNEWYRLLKKQKRTIPFGDAIDDLVAIINEPDFVVEDPLLKPRVEDDLSVAQLASILLGLLPDHDRTGVRIVNEMITRLAAGEDLSQAAIARAVGLHRSTVCRRFALLRPALRQCASLTIDIPESRAGSM